MVSKRILDTFTCRNLGISGVILALPRNELALILTELGVSKLHQTLIFVRLPKV